MKKNFSFYTLAEREQKAVKSGQCVCLCGCAWANCGGSSSMDNANANSELDLDSREYTPQNSN
jgi:hypothetical protein